MAKKKGKKRKGTAKKTRSSEAKKITYTGKLSMVIPLYNEENRLHYLEKPLAQFHNLWKQPYEIVFVDDGSKDNTLAKLKEKYADASNDKVTYQVIGLEENQGKGGALKAGVEAATGDHILTLDADMAAKPTQLIQWLRLLPDGTFPDDKILIATREHKDSKLKAEQKRRLLGMFFNYWVQLLTGLNHSDTQCGFKLYPKAIAKELFGQLSAKGWANDVELLYKASLMDIAIEGMPVEWEEIADSKVSVWLDGIKMGLTVFWIFLNTNFRYFFVDPFKKQPSSLQTKESKWFRFGFGALVVLLFLLMPMISFDYGITGDEQLQRIYGEHVLNYYETNGEDQKALEYRNLYYYGGLFDYQAAWYAKYIFTDWPVYDTRHFINSITGATLFFFTGLLARSLTGSWLIALLSVLFAALSPRVFGHAMNNPKDIPFAAGYIITLYFMVNFLKQLPKPSIKHIAGLIVGIAIAINIRVGGILLIAYLGMFTGLKLLLTKELRKVGVWFKVGILGAAIAFLGYMGGMLYWPYGALAPFEHPLKALSEMSNFSTGIRVLFNGENVWSDNVPSNYIPVWFMVTTPLVVLIGSLIGLVYMGARFKKLDKITYGLLLFVGLFPPAYAIYQDSALYDGIRHMLFAYMTLPILAAIGWGTLMNNQWIRQKAVQIGTAVVVIVLCALPLRFMVANHPYQYVYFNELQGGMEGANTNFELDYWMNSMKELCAYFDKEIDTNPQDTLIVATNCVVPVKHYLVVERPEDQRNIKVKYVRFHEREKQPWDYGMFFNRFIDEKFLENKVWPVEDVVYEVKADGVPIGALTKRETQDGYEAQKAINKNEFGKAISLLEGLVSREPKNESALLLLIQTAARANQLEKMKKYGEQLLALSDEYANGLGLMGVYYLNKQNVPKAKEYFEKAVKFNYKYTFGHYHLARIAVSEQDYDKAMKHFELFDANGGRPVNGYNLAIQVAQQTKDNVRLYYFQAKLFAAQGKINESYQAVTNALVINPEYEPAKNLKARYDEQSQRQRRNRQRKQK